MRKRLVVLLSFLFLLALAPVCMAQSSNGIDAQSIYLHGLKGYFVKVETLGADALIAGLRESDIKSSVEFQLRQNKIAVFNEEDAANDPAVAILYVSVPSASVKDLTSNQDIVYVVKVDVLQRLAPTRDPSLTAVSPSWSHSGLGLSPAASFRDNAINTVKGYIAAFALQHAAGQLPPQHQ